MHKPMKRIWMAVLLALGLALLVGGAALAQEPTPSDDEVNAIARQLYCPVCENIPLDVCPTQACAEWRELIRLKLSQGWNENEIKAYFAEQYGVRVLASPPARGFNWLAYVIPPLVIVAGIIVLVTAMQNKRQPKSEVPAPPVPPLPPDEYVNRLEEEVRKR